MVILHCHISFRRGIYLHIFILKTTYSSCTQSPWDEQIQGWSDDLPHWQTHIQCVTAVTLGTLNCHSMLGLFDVVISCYFITVHVTISVSPTPYDPCMVNYIKNHLHEWPNLWSICVLSHGIPIRKKSKFSGGQKPSLSESFPPLKPQNLEKWRF